MATHIQHERWHTKSIEDSEPTLKLLVWEDGLDWKREGRGFEGQRPLLGEVTFGEDQSYEIS